VARAADTPLFGKDDYDEVAIQGNDCWVGVEFDTLLDAKVSVPVWTKKLDPIENAGFRQTCLSCVGQR
jgi:hypothetical protein